MKKEEAEKQATELKPDWWCPLTMNMCNPKCACYFKPTPYNENARWGESPPDKWEVRGNACTCYMLIGNG